jgi:hypothetical protein
MITDLAETYAAVRAARSPEYNRRCAAHECGHAIVGRALGSFIELVTIVPNNEYAGRCVRRGAPSTSLNLLDETKLKGQTPTALTTVDILDICAKIGTPEVGTPRVDLAEEITRSQTNIIECLGGAAGEAAMFPELPPLPAEHDRAEARAFASVICASPLAVDSLLAYAEAEARALIQANRPRHRRDVDRCACRRGHFNGRSGRCDHFGLRRAPQHGRRARAAPLLACRGRQRQ